jgi:GABA permease
MARRVLAVVTDPLDGEEEIDEIRQALGGDEAELRVVVPAVEANAFRHALGDVDGPSREARVTLERSLQALRAAGIEARGEVGDPEPIRAAQDALLALPADEVLIFEHAATQERWFEDGLLERAQEEIEPPLRVVIVETEPERSPHVVEVERTGAGTVEPHEHEVGTSYLPGLSRGDFAGMVAGVVGTIVVAVLAAVVTAEDGADSAAGAAAILIAIGTALVNMAHVVGLTLFETVHYRGGWEKFFRTLALVGTPLAVLANLLILLLS